MKRIGHILTGWGKAFGLITTTNAEAKLSVLRMKVCGKCEFAETKKVLALLNGNANYENSCFCTKCGCPCLEKSLVVDEQCPINRW
jgi:hypothetical protein